MARTVKIEGLRELERTLATLSKATGRNVLKRALKKGAEPLADDMRAAAPVLTGTLRRSIAASARKPHGHKSPGKQAFADAMRAGADRKAAGAAAREANRANPVSFAEAFAGPGRDPAAIQQEFGNRRHGPQAFVRPAWDSGKDDALDRVVEAITTELGKAVARAERKARKAASR